MLRIIKIISKHIIHITLALVMVFSGFPSSYLVDFVSEKIQDRNVVDLMYHAAKDSNLVDVSVKELLKPSIPRAHAATFDMQTGYYVGNAVDNRGITGVGFQPDLLLLKDNTTGGNEGVIFKTSSMAGELSISIAETDAVLSTNHVQSLDSDGFTVGTDADVNGANVAFHWVAFDGSDCSASGTFCVGSYTGNGGTQSITSVGFQPDYVAVKRSGASIGLFKTSSHSGTVSSSFANIADLASGGIESLDATGFSVGSDASANTNANTYYFFAFKNVSGAFDVGTYTGNGVDNNSIDSTDDAGLTFQPDFVMVKSTIAASAVGSIREHYGDRSFVFTDTASAANVIQRLQSSGGFTLGTNTLTNSNAQPYYFAAWGGAVAKPAANENFQMVNGSYTGTGLAFSVTGLPFDPDLVIIKHSDQVTDQYAVWRSRVMQGNITHYFGNGATTFSGGITALGTTSFSVGTSATVNTSGDTYYWTAFGNAAMPDLAGNAEDFLVGMYIGTNTDNTDIDRLSLQPDFVAVKRVGATVGVWRTSNLVGDLTLHFPTTVASSNVIQSLDSDGFQIGTGFINSLSNTHHYFAFGGSSCSESGKFCVGSYAGNNIAQDITSIGFQPDMVWIKKESGGTARAAVFRTSAQTGDDTSPFLNLPSLAGEITNLISGGFSIGTGTVNDSGNSPYQFAAWDAKRYTQSTYRFFENADSADVGAVLEAQDTPAILASTGDAFRLRMTLRSDYGNLFASGKDFKLQYVDKGAGTCASPSGGTPASYTDVTDSTLIAYNDNATPADDGALTPNANDPTDGGRTIVNQSYIESNPFTNNQSAITNQSQSGKWDFSLIDNGAAADTTYCFRVVGNTSATVLDTYTNYPEITTSASVSQSLSFSLSDNSIGFGTLSPSSARYATGDTAGAGADSADAHTMSASTNASGGYVISLSGSTLSCVSCGGSTIDAIGDTAVASSTGTEQFGLRAIVNSGTGTATSPYNGSNWAFDTAAFPDQVASGDGDAVSTEFGLRYIGNISSSTDAGDYTGTLTYTITASY